MKSLRKEGTEFIYHAVFRQTADGRGEKVFESLQQTLEMGAHDKSRADWREAYLTPTETSSKLKTAKT